MLLQNSQVTSSQYQDLTQLMQLCRQADGGLPIIYEALLLKQRETESNVLCYQDNQLTGFLSVYFFYEQACEITLLVAPEKRRQGIATQLLKTILPLLQTRHVTQLVFSSAPIANRQFFHERLNYHHSEYHMQRRDNKAIVIQNPALCIREATWHDVASLCAIDAACFNERQVDMPARFIHLLANHYTLLLASYRTMIIGKAHLNCQTETVFLSDIAILPAWQGKGYGKELIAHSINHALNLGKTCLELDVEADNNQAINLYGQQGFQTTNSHDYWSIAMDTLFSG